MSTPYDAAFEKSSYAVIRSIAGATLFALSGVFALAQQAPTRSESTGAGAPMAAPTPAEVNVGNGGDSADSEDEAVVLSPFVVNSEADTGYAASGTLMGTRLRTDLKDLASSISAITKDFMLDVNATDLEGLLTYTTGTEVGGVGGNFAGSAPSGDRTIDGDASNNGATSATRIRGLGSADITRDYFLSGVPVDSFNFDRLEISRGPNSLLYGLGAPAGIINTNLKKADLRRSRGNLGTQYGSYGSTRATLGYNQVLIKDKLAIRVDSLYKDTRYRIEDTFARDKRAYAAVTYAPFRNTVVKANIEFGEQVMNQPRNQPPLDNFSHWWPYGQQTYDPTTKVEGALGTRDPRVLSGEIPFVAVNVNQFGDVAVNNFMVWEDPNSAVAGISITGNPQVMTNRGDRLFKNANGTLAEGALGSLTAGVNYSRRLHPTSDPGRSFYRWLAITDPNIFDFYHYQLDGPNNLKTNKWYATNASIEQRFFHDKLGLEAAFSKENLDTSVFRNSTSQEYAIFLDINTKLLNGDVNPNFGRPLMVATGNQTQTDADREAKRLTAYYDLDLGKTGPDWLGKVLGRHVFTAAYSDQDSFRFERSAYPISQSPDFQEYHTGLSEPGIINTLATSRRAVSRVSYLGPSWVGIASMKDIPTVQPVTAARLATPGQSVRWLTTQIPTATAKATNPWVIDEFSLSTVNGTSVDGAVRANNAVRKRENIKSQVLVSNSRWFEGNVVTTFGWRRDEWDYKSTSGNPPVDPATGRGLVDPVNFAMLPSARGDREDHSSYGIAVHAPEFIRRHLPLGLDFSLYASGANNFQVRSQRYDIHNNPIDAEQGDTREYGFRVAMLDRKIELRATHYETSATLSRDSTTGSTVGQINDRLEGIIEAMYTANGYFQSRWRDNYISTVSASVHQDYLAAKNALDAFIATPQAQEWFDTFRFNITTDPVTGQKRVDGRDNRSNEIENVTDSVSDGWEFEAVFNPTRSWRLAVSGAQQHAVKSNSSKLIIDQLYDVFDPLLFQPLSRVATYTGTQRDFGASGFISFRADALGTVYTGPNRARSLDGSAVPEVRPWRWSVVTRYSFRDGWLKGFEVGGSMRWEDNVNLGYPYIFVDDPKAGQIAVIDIAQPFYGPAETTYDAFLRYSRKLTKRVNWTLQFNVKNIGVGNEIIPTHADPDGSYASFRIREPQLWTLSNSFDF